MMRLDRIALALAVAASLAVALLATFGARAGGPSPTPLGRVEEQVRAAAAASAVSLRLPEAARASEREFDIEAPPLDSGRRPSDAPSTQAAVTPARPLLVRIKPVSADDRAPFLAELRDIEVHVVESGRSTPIRWAQSGAHELEFELPEGSRQAHRVAVQVAARGAANATLWRGSCSLNGPRFIQAWSSTVELKCETPWLEGVVVGAEGGSLMGARIELAAANTGEGSHPNARVRGRADEWAAEASAELRTGRFSVAAPARALPELARARVVFSDGTRYTFPDFVRAYSNDVELQIPAASPVVGRLVYLGAPAQDLVTVHVEQAGARIGAARVDVDGKFEVRDAPDGRFELVLTASRLGGELARLAFGQDRGQAKPQLTDVGDIEVSALGALIELELVDSAGQPSAGRLRWRAPGSAGGASLGAAPLHRLLLARDHHVQLEVDRGADLPPVPLIAHSGRLTVVVDR